VKNLLVLLIFVFTQKMCMAQYLSGIGQGETTQQVDAKLLDGSSATATKLNFTTSPPNALGNQRFTVVVDIFGSNDLRINSEASINLSIGTNPSAGSLSGILTGTATTGRIIFLGLSVNNPGSGYTLQASAAGLTSSISQSFDIYGNIYGGGIGDGFDENQNLNATAVGGQKLWRGSISTDWATAGNWYPSGVPSSTDPISIENNANNNNPILDGNRTVSSVDFSGAGKKIEVGAFTLTVSEALFNADASNFVKTASTGTVKRTITNSESFTFPVGNSAYNPVTITNNTGTSDAFSMRVLDDVYWKGTTGGIATTPKVQRTWLIDKTNPTANAGSGVDFVFNWNTGEMTAGVNTPKLYHFDGTVWNKLTGTTSSTTHSLAYTGYKGSFSPFAIGDDVVLLPITWLSFRCETQQNQTLLQWKTASEANTRAFFVERSNNGSDYTSIGEVPAAGYSQSPRSYSFSDPEPNAGKTLYRVRMEDMDGQIAYSAVCSSNTNQTATAAPLKVYPNPTQGGLYMVAMEPERNFVWEVYTPSGKQLASGLSKDGLAEANMHHLSEGVYIIRVTGSGLAENHRIIISR
jgi:hypothetical protein